MKVLRILDPGVQATFQDRGRPGYEALGITESGAADRLAYHLVNRLLENPVDAPAIEILLGRFRAEILRSCTLAIGGAETDATLEGRPIRRWSRFRAEAGQILELGFAREGQIAYLGIRGGFDAPRYFGSVSVNLREGLGKPLARNEEIDAGSLASETMLPATLAPRIAPSYGGEELILRYLPGYQEAWFDRERFESAEFRIARYDKMGYRLQGPPILPRQRSLLSEGICYGAIQITHEGDPIVLLSERQSIGGYPKIGSILPPDGWRLSQYGAGTRIRFRCVTPRQARRILYPARPEEIPWFPFPG
ncbi:5-oxoprolinase subunit C family protein [Nitratifractor sp.]